jgi:signal transduction histidine kinase
VTGETVVPPIAPATRSVSLTPVPVETREQAVRDVLPAVVRQLPVGVGVIRRDRTIAYHNDEFGRVLRLERDGLPMRAMRRADGTTFGPGDEPVDRVLRTGIPAPRLAVMAMRVDGTVAEAAVTTTPIIEASGDVIGGVLYLEDTSQDRDDVSLREAFIGVLSHELRTPITAIYGGAQLLRNERVTDDVRATVIDDIAAEAEQLHRLIEDLLAIARIERGVTDVATEPVLLQRLARQAAAAEERRWPGRTVTVEAAPDLPAVRADDGYSMQVLRNLISNAVKYSPRSEPVTVSIRADRDEVMVSVHDRGAGFPPETGPDAFRLFYRSPTVAAHVPGTGIGLFVARALIEAQGGRIWLRNRPDGGAEVGFALPRFWLDDID